MRTPSIKTLESVFPGKGKELKSVLLMRRSELLATSAGAARDAECHNPPTTRDLRFTVLNAVAETYGVEAIRAESDFMYEDCADYLNTGDSYTPTIICFRGNYRVQSIGDFMERSRVAFA